MSILVFPGQGSQSFIEALKYRPVQETLNKAQEILGYDINNLNEEQKKRTDFNQLQVFVQSMAILELYKQNPELFITAEKVNPETKNIDFVAGHSLGQYSACVAAGVFSFESGLDLVKRRGELMQKCIENNPGSMVACIGNNVFEVVERVIDQMQDVFIANYNSKNQIVISGKTDSIEKAVEAYKNAGLRCVPLQVAGPFHTPLMTTANDEMNAILESTEFADPKAGFMTNKVGDIVLKAEKVKADLINQIVSPVRWATTMTTLESIVGQIYEIGPGQVLSKIIENSLGIQVISLESLGK